MNQIRDHAPAASVALILIFSFMCGTFVNAQKPPQTPSTHCPPLTAKIFASSTIIKAGTESEFEIQSEDGERISGEFIWATSTGTIVSGQGTNRIIVATPESALSEVTPDSLPTPDQHGYIWSPWVGRQRVPLRVTASSISLTGCNDLQLTTEVSIGKASAAVNLPANVIDLSLDKFEAGVIVGNACSSSVIGVSTKAADPENDVITYKYMVTAGKIVGHGANVQWNLSGVAPGTYEITASVDDGCGVCGKTVTKSVTFSKCF